MFYMKLIVNSNRMKRSFCECVLVVSVARCIGVTSDDANSPCCVALFLHVYQVCVS